MRLRTIPGHTIIPPHVLNPPIRVNPTLHTAQLIFANIMLTTSAAIAFNPATAWADTGITERREAGRTVAKAFQEPADRLLPYASVGHGACVVELAIKICMRHLELFAMMAVMLM